MRGIAKQAFILALSAAAVCCGLAPPQAEAQQQKIVYVGIGGPTQAALRKALFQPFEKATGIQVVEGTGLGPERVQAEVQSGHPSIDFLTIGTSAYTTLLAKGLLAPIDYKYYDPKDLSGIPAAVRLKYAVGSIYSSLGMAFSKAAFPDGKPQPQSWADFWDVKKFPGKRTLPFCGVLEGSWPIAEAALMADGVPTDKLYPIDIPRAVKTLKELAPNVIWWRNTNQPGQYMATGEAVMDLDSIGRTSKLIASGVPLQYVWNGALLFGDKWIVVKGAPHYDNVMRFLAFVAHPQVQADLARLIGYAPTNTHAYDFMTKDEAMKLATYPDNMRQTFQADNAWWASNVTKWTEACLNGLSG